MTKQSDNKESDDALAEFLANGGVIQKIGRNVSGLEEGHTQIWGMPRKAGRPKTPDTKIKPKVS